MNEDSRLTEIGRARHWGLMYHGFDLFQERSFRSEWHQEREKASIDFRRVVEDQPRDVRMVVAAFNKIEKVTNCVSLISDPCIERLRLCQRR